MAIQVVILAAGQGKRMHSALPKVLHELAGKTLLEHVIDTALRVTDDTSPIIINGHQGNKIINALSQHKVRWVEQKEQLGTGHALMQALPEIAADAHVLVLYGDVPLMSEHTLKALITSTPKNAIGMITMHLPNPTGYGRIKRNKQHAITSIVEEKDATADERTLTEINSGIYFVPAALLKKWLPTLQNKNAQNEYYLTDIVGMAALEKITTHTVSPQFSEEIFGVNDRVQLAQLERFINYNKRKIHASRCDVHGSCAF